MVGRGGLLLTAVLVAAGLGSCTYDFDAPFAESPGGQGATSAGGMTGGGGSGNAAAGAGGTSTGGGAPGEICDNGLDDEGDDLVDCADPECTSMTCVPGAPEGWTGPLAVAVLPAETDLEPCAGSWETSDTIDCDPTGAPAQCSGCSCGPPTVSCSLAATNSHTSYGCSGSPEASITPSAENVCTPFSVNDLDSLEGQSTFVTGGSCFPSGGNPSNAPPTWLGKAHVCSDPTVGGGCSDEQLCVPAASNDYALCVSRTGDFDCVGGYSEKTLIDTGYTDSRGCSSCACTLQNPQCTGSTQVWIESSSCVGSPDVVVQNDGNDCIDIGGGDENGSIRFTSQGNASGCAPSGGQPQGSVAGTDPITYCCLP